MLTLEMDEQSYLGGITFDGFYIWICNSSKRAVERLDFSRIEEASRKGETKLIKLLGEEFKVTYKYTMGDRVVYEDAKKIPEQ